MLERISVELSRKFWVERAECLSPVTFQSPSDHNEPLGLLEHADVNFLLDRVAPGNSTRAFGSAAKPRNHRQVPT